MKALELKKIGFVKTFVTKEESGFEDFSYYTFDIGSLCLITNESEPYYVELFNYDEFRFYDIK